jgi:ADP-ribose pyrophosphatase
LSRFEEITVGSKAVFDGRVFSVRVDNILLPGGKPATREMVLHNGGASVVALDHDENIYLVRQWRHPFHTELLELPAGKLGPGEDPRDCAARELREETGMAAGKLIPLGQYMATPAYCSEVLHIYLALDLEKSQQCLDEGEFLEVVKIPFQEAFEMVISGEIKDAKTQVGILKAYFMLKNKEFVNYL